MQMVADHHEFQNMKGEVPGWRGVPSVHFLTERIEGMENVDQQGPTRCHRSFHE
jgi:hypothetical protein